MSEWIEMQIGEIGYFKTSGVDKVIKPDEKIVRLVNYMDVYGSVKIDNSFYLSETSATQHEIDSFDLKKGDVLFTPTSETPDDIGHSAVIIEGLENAVYSYHLTRFREYAEKILDDEFKAYLFNQYFVLHQFEIKAAGTTRYTLTRGSFESTFVRFPKDKSVQNKIAKILSTADAVIEKTQGAIAKYKAIKQGMLQDLFTRGIDLSTNKLRPRYEDAPHLYKESKLGWIPREWEEKELSYYLSFISYGFTNPMPETEDGPFLVTAANVNGGRIQYETARKTSQYAFDNLLTDKSRPKVNDILLTKDGTLGRIAIVEKENLCINQSVAVLRPNKSVNPIFLKILMESPTCQKKMLDDSRGSAIKHIYITDVDKMIVAFPLIDEQGKIAERLTTIDNKLQTEQAYLQKMQSLKKGLMEDLLSGRKRVKVKENINAMENE